MYRAGADADCLGHHRRRQTRVPSVRFDPLARLFLFDSLARLWATVTATGESPMEARAIVRLAASHAASSAVQAVDLMYTAAGASSVYASCPLERAFRDVHTITQHHGVQPRVMESTGRVLLGLEPDTPLL